jgi:hypothetical protein
VIKKLSRWFRRDTRAEDALQQARQLSRQQKRALVAAAGWRRARLDGHKSEYWAKGGRYCSLQLAAVAVLTEQGEAARG